MKEEWGYVRQQVVNKGEQVRIEILGVGAKGDFYGKHKNFIIFIKDLKKCSVGEHIMVEITEVKDKCAFAKKI